LPCSTLLPYTTLFRSRPLPFHCREQADQVERAERGFEIGVFVLQNAPVLAGAKFRERPLGALADDEMQIFLRGRHVDPPGRKPQIGKHTSELQSRENL